MRETRLFPAADPELGSVLPRSRHEHDGMPSAAPPFPDLASLIRATRGPYFAQRVDFLTRPARYFFSPAIT
jgi:hypothetical protein